MLYKLGLQQAAVTSFRLSSTCVYRIANFRWLLKYISLADL